MKQSKCSKCGETKFAIEQMTPLDSAYKISLVKCIDCGTVVGALDFYVLQTVLNDQKEQSDKLYEAIDAVNQNLGTIIRKLNS